MTLVKPNVAAVTAEQDAILGAVLNEIKTASEEAIAAYQAREEELAQLEAGEKADADAAFAEALKPLEDDIAKRTTQIEALELLLSKRRLALHQAEEKAKDTNTRAEKAKEAIAAAMTDPLAYSAAQYADDRDALQNLVNQYEGELSEAETALARVRRAEQLLQGRKEQLRQAQETYVGQKILQGGEQLKRHVLAKDKYKDLLAEAWQTLSGVGPTLSAKREAAQAEHDAVIAAEKKAARWYWPKKILDTVYRVAQGVMTVAVEGPGAVFEALIGTFKGGYGSSASAAASSVAAAAIDAHLKGEEGSSAPVIVDQKSEFGVTYHTYSNGSVRAVKDGGLTAAAASAFRRPSTTVAGPVAEHSAYMRQKFAAKVEAGGVY